MCGQSPNHTQKCLLPPFLLPASSPSFCISSSSSPSLWYFPVCNGKKQPGKGDWYKHCTVHLMSNLFDLFFSRVLRYDIMQIQACKGVTWFLKSTGMIQQRSPASLALVEFPFLRGMPVTECYTHSAMGETLTIFCGNAFLKVSLSLSLSSSLKLK